MRLTKDLLAGLLFLSFGAGGAAIAATYGIGTAARMGPGYFPTVVGVAVAGLGVVLTFQALIRPSSSEPVEAGKIRPILLVGLSVLAFGALIEAAGLLVAVPALITVAWFATREGTSIELLVLATSLTLAASAIFVWGLNIPLKLTPW